MSLSWSALSRQVSVPPLCVEEWCPRRRMYSLQRIVNAEKAAQAQAVAEANAYTPTPAIGYEKYRKRAEQVRVPPPNPQQ